MNQISVEELHDRLKAEKGLRIIDVREQDEFETFNLGAKCFPLSQLKVMNAEGIEDWKDKEVIVHCKSGQRSLQACLFLETMGFSNVITLQGGLKAWQEKYNEEKFE